MSISSFFHFTTWKYINRNGDLKNKSLGFGVAIKLASIAISVIAPMFYQDILFSFDDDNEPSAINFSGAGLNALLVLYPLFWIAANITSSISEYYVLKGARGPRSSAASNSLSHIYNLPYSHFVNMQTGDLIQTAVDIPYSAIGDIIKEGVNMVAVPLELLGIAVIIAASYSPLIGWFLLGGALTYSAIIYVATEALLASPSENYAKAQGAFRSRLYEMVDYLETSQLFGASESELRKFGNVQTTFEETYLEVERRKNLIIRPLQSLLIGLVLFGITWISGKKVLDSSAFSENEFVLVNYYFITFISKLNNFVMHAIKFTESTGRIKKAIQFNDDSEKHLSEYSDLLRKRKDTNAAGVKDDATSALSIEFKNVSLAFNQTKPEERSLDDLVLVHPVLSNASFAISQGEFVAIIGPTGSGKSTISRLITGIFEPMTTKMTSKWFSIAGDIRLNNISIKRISTQDLISVIGVVPQKVDIFEGSWRENLTYGYTGEVSDRQLRKICKQVLLSELIPDDLDTEISKGKLSGGEKQRIGLARVLLKRPKLIILDEATSALDVDTKTRFMDVFCEWLSDGGKGKKQYKPTVIMITHDLSALNYVDRVMLLDDGGFAESGPPSELATRDGVYSKLVNTYACQNPTHAKYQKEKHETRDGEEQYFSFFRRLKDYHIASQAAGGNDNEASRFSDISPTSGVN